MMIIIVENTITAENIGIGRGMVRGRSSSLSRGWWERRRGEKQRYSDNIILMG